MTRFEKEFEADTGNGSTDHNGNYNYKYVSWLEDKICLLENQLEEIIEDRVDDIINDEPFDDDSWSDDPELGYKG